MTEPQLSARASPGARRASRSPSLARFIVGLALAAALSVVHGAQCLATSGARTAALVELYTSEGCNSCPPADRWLSRLGATRDSLVVPLAFHVDYWDYLGWKDRFARPEFARRQRATADHGGIRFVYTPQILLQGRDHGAWRKGDGAQEFAAINRRPARADIALKLASAGRTVDIALQMSSRESDAVAYLAVVESGLSSAVAAGENRGERLRHDFVVREWLGPYPATGAGKDGAPVSARIQVAADWDASRLGIVAVVRASAYGEVLQALSLPVCW